MIRRALGACLAAALISVGVGAQPASAVDKGNHTIGVDEEKKITGTIAAAKPNTPTTPFAQIRPFGAEASTPPIATH